MRTAPAPLRALGGALTLVTILCGPPAAFWSFRAALLDSWPASFADVRRLLTDYDTGRVFLTLLVLIGLISWLQLVAAVVVEAVGLLRGAALPRISGLSWARKIAAGVLLLMLTGTAAATAAEQPPAPAVAIVATTTSETAPASTTGYEVKPGDSLIRIAAHELGDGRRYHEIFALNQGKPQPDGETLRDVGLVKQGWRLTLPPRQSEEIVVHAGDTLSSIARDHLGDAQRYHDLFAANTNQRQPSGHQLTDPDDIHPGDVLRLPANNPSPGQTQDVPAPSASPPSAPSTRPSPHASLVPRSTTLAPMPQPRPALNSAPAEDNSGDGAMVAVGVAGMITAGILATAGARRLVAQRGLRNKSDESMETTVPSRELPDPPSVDSLHRALRALAASAVEVGRKVPLLRAVWVGESGIRLEPEEPADPIPPFNAETSTPREWILDSAVTCDETASETAGPYPLLVSLGETDDGELALISLDRVGVLLVHGEPRRIRDTVVELANDLAGSPWSRNVIVSLIAAGEHFDDANCYDTLDDLLDRLERTAEQQCDDLHVVFSSQPLTADHIARLGGPAATSVAAIVAPAEPDVTIPGAWALDLDLDPTPAEALGVELHLPRFAACADDQPLAPCVDAPVPDAPRPAVAAPEPVTPELQLLGPVRLRGVDMDKVEGKKINRLTELAAFLALNPGAHADEISRQLGTDAQPWSAATRQGYISRLRTWLGHDPAGNLYLPNVDAKQGGYRLSETLTTDWSRFRDLTRAGLDTETGRLAHLQQALDLVGGLPLGNVPDSRYAWASWHQREMTDAIVDVAHTLAVGFQDKGDLVSARRAVVRGLLAEPTSEILLRDTLRIERRAGNASAVQATVDRLNTIAVNLESELDDETTLLINGMARGSGAS
ncbi:LysM peptidoglycan-binding domain-containing protein [Amycolatopsis sp. NPDC047767]|uniref:LysM peptidoglycan-binding domain-containing protein n=1 Tax=Amycolatopsis sp. NPDC047767 TaxID=3156765 RepID=UPI0034522F15